MAGVAIVSQAPAEEGIARVHTAAADPEMSTAGQDIDRELDAQAFGPATGTPTAAVLVVDAPAVDVPVVDARTVDTQAVDARAGDTPVGHARAGDARAAVILVVDAPAVVDITVTSSWLY